VLRQERRTPKGVKRWRYTCCVKNAAGSECGAERDQDGNGSGSLFDHVRKSHPELYLSLAAKSSHTSVQDIDGVMTRVLTFEDQGALQKEVWRAQRRSAIRGRAIIPCLICFVLTLS
jgi:hypothetical protein